jgi:IS30 family transposase
VLAQRTCRGEHPQDIAAVIGCHRGTVYREWRRNGQDGQYFPARAQATAEARRRSSKAPWKMDHPPLAPMSRTNSPSTGRPSRSPDG